MIITDKFVMLNFPKSGSTFARAVLNAIYAEREKGDWLIKFRLRQSGVRELKMPVVDKMKKRKGTTQHGTYRQVPAAHQHKLILSIMRNPFSRYVSAYLYRYWAKFPHADISVLQEDYPAFPDLSFSEYYEMKQRYGCPDRLRGIKPPIELGFQTIQFIQMYFKDPDRVLSNIDHEYIESEAYLNDMPPAFRFLHQESLRSELKMFLLEQGYSEAEAELAETTGRERVSPRKADQQDDAAFYDDALTEKMLNRDALLFKIFPEYLPANMSKPL